MRLSTALITANTTLHAGTHLIEMQAPQLAQAAQPGQYCMVRCCDSLATDPLLRRPFFIHSTQRDSGLCRLLVHARGRGSAWLARQQEGAPLDVFGPMGHGWTIRPTFRHLLLLNEGMTISSLTFLAQRAIEQELSVTLVSQSDDAGDVYPPALLPAEVEYHIVTGDGSVGQQGDLLSALASTPLNPIITWADAVYCSVSRETLHALYQRFERFRRKSFAQAVLLQPLVCAGGICLACRVETASGQKLICHDGPVFDLPDVAR